MLEAGGTGGETLKKEHTRGALCCEEMYLHLSITSDDNAMFSGLDGQKIFILCISVTKIFGKGWCPQNISTSYASERMC